MSLYKYKRKNINDAFSRTKFRNDHYILGVCGGGGVFFPAKKYVAKVHGKKIKWPEGCKIFNNLSF